MYVVVHIRYRNCTYFSGTYIHALFPIELNAILKLNAREMMLVRSTPVTFSVVMRSK
jgi:hypothetical protein